MRRLIVIASFGSLLAIGLAVSVAQAQDAHKGHDHDGPGHGQGHEGHGHAEAHDEHALPKCPVMGEPINFNVSASTDEGPVYFCCKGCVKKFAENPGKYSAKVALMREALAHRAKIQVNCPVGGGPVDETSKIEHEGETVRFCCEKCAGKFKADPSKFRAALANSYTYQTKCPVTDETIKATASAELPTGETVYYCCKMCHKKLLENPEKYAAKMEAQGYGYNVKKLKAELAKG